MLLAEAAVVLVQMLLVIGQVQHQLVLLVITQVAAVAETTVIQRRDPLEAQEVAVLERVDI
jgi:hypothetical protein